MKAEDTVTYTWICDRHLLNDAHSEGCEFYNQGKKAQAEASFKAGIKEVVEWCEEHRPLIKNSARYIEWQSKLKEWGIEDKR